MDQLTELHIIKEINNDIKEPLELDQRSLGKVSDNIFNNIEKYRHEEYQYIHLIQHILDNGLKEKGRNGETTSIFGHTMRFSLQNGQIPLLTTKKTAWKTCLKELLWFIRGETDVKLLQKQGVHIWDDNSSRDFLNSRGLRLTKEGLIGPAYGYQWRNFNANYNCFSGKKLLDTDQRDIHKNVLHFKGIDQLQKIIDQLKNVETRNSRRLILTAWNPAQLDQMALPPCHILCQFNVHDGNKLSCSMYQRSCDVICGQPFNIASYSFLTHLIAQHCGLEAYEFVYFMGNCHIYEEHIEAAKTQILREPFTFPTVSIAKIRENINDYMVEDFIINNYQSHEAIKVKMVA
jgi:thymidylate synthase